MDNIVKIIQELRNTSSTNDKLAILRREEDNELLQKVLEYTYNPFKKYGLSEKSINPVCDKPLAYFDIFDLLDVLANNNINDSLKYEANNFVGNFGNYEDLQDIYKCMILKDLRINVGSKGVNKVFPNLIPSFDVMLAESYFKQKEGFLKSEFILTTKLDGIRCVAIKENNKLKFYSRQGQLIEGLNDIEKELDLLPNGFIIDGELVLKNLNNLPSDELYRATVKVVRKDGIKENVEFHVFDMIKLESFKNGKDKIPCHHRKEMLSDFVYRLNSECIVEVPILYKGEDTSKIMELLDIAKANNQEGIMLNIADAPYECKRSKSILKVKVFQDGDMKVIDILEGTGKNNGKLGAITIQFEYESKLYTCDCGSGFKDTERELYFNKPELLIGKIVTIGYFEISQNSKTKEYSLRFPTWKGIIREDKTEISMN